jgi:hypothetical protein
MYDYGKKYAAAGNPSYQLSCSPVAVAVAGSLQVLWFGRCNSAIDLARSNINFALISASPLFQALISFIFVSHCFKHSFPPSSSLTVSSPHFLYLRLSLFQALISSIFVCLSLFQALISFIFVSHCFKHSFPPSSSLTVSNTHFLHLRLSLSLRFSMSMWIGMSQRITFR